jgi:hypothetical protein
VKGSVSLAAVLTGPQTRAGDRADQEAFLLYVDRAKNRKR